jgi:hypothetical protein
MIQDSNAPSDMQPWVRQTEAEIEALKNTVEKLVNQLNQSGARVDSLLNSSLDNTFNFNPQQDGSTMASAGTIDFDGTVSTLQPLNVEHSLVVGQRTELIEAFDEEIGETVFGTTGSSPYIEIAPGSVSANPVTQEDFYTPGTFKINDTSIDINGYGQISGDGLAITLNNPSNVAGYRAEIVDVTSGVIYQDNPALEEGDPEDEILVTIYEIADSPESREVIAVGNYINITGCEPEELNESNALIVEIDLLPDEYLKFKILKDSSTITYVSGGEVSSNKPDEVYESTLSVRGPGGINDHFGATVSPGGISVGPDGGNLDEAFSLLNKDGLITSSVTALEALSVNSTRVFIQSEEPEDPVDGDLWIDSRNPANTQGSSVSVTAPITNTGTSTDAVIGLNTSNIAPIASPTFTGAVTAPIIRLTSTSAVELTSTTHALQLGASNSENLAFDRNSIMARNNGLAANIRINEDGGNIELGDSGSTISGDGKLSVGDRGPFTSGFVTAASGWALSGTSTYRERNGIAMVSIGLTRTGGAITVPTGGNITNTGVAVLGVGYRPIMEAWVGTGPSGPVASAYINTSGSVILTAVSHAATIPTGFDIDLNGTFIVA